LRAVFLLVAATVGLAAALGFGVVGPAGERLISEAQREAARTELGLILSIADVDGPQALVRAVRLRAANTATADDDDGFVALIGPDGAVRAGRMDAWSRPLSEPAPDWRLYAITNGGATRALHLIGARTRDGGLLLVGRDLSKETRFAAALAESLTLSLAVVAAAALLAGAGLNALVMARVRAIAAAAQRVAAGDLSTRVAQAPRPRGDPFDRLARALNAMLDRIDALMTGMRAVTDAVAHDLRTPLAHAKAALDEADSNDPAQRAEALDRSAREIDQALSTLTSLMDIARAEAGVSRETLQDTDLGALLADIADLFEPAVEDAGQTLVLQASPLIWPADGALLRQALGNLIHNAVKYAGKGAVVTLSLEARPDAVDLIVADTGRGAPSADLARLPERFVRLDTARGTPGSGLGLSIAAACAKLHAGALILSDNDPGLRAILRLGRL
jgi:signal transduction histidine kinase